MKIKGAEFMDWYDNHFPVGYYHDDSIETHKDDGSWALDPTADYDTDDLGYVAKDDARFSNEDSLSVESEIRRYRKARDYDLKIVSIPKAKMDEVLAYLKAAGCKVEK